MRIPRLLVQDGAPLAEGMRDLSADAAHHITRVLRRRPGDVLVLFDGHGTSWQGTIESCSAKSCRVHLTNLLDEATESPLQMHLGLALLRGDRMDYALQKVTELGATSIHLLQSERVEVRLEGTRLARRMNHLRGVIHHAAQQSGRTRIPELSEPSRLDGLPERLIDADVRLVLDPEGAAATPPVEPPRAVSLLTGPEGGWSPADLEMLNASGFDAVRLGPRVLRAETAPVVGATLLQAEWGDLRQGPAD